MIDAIAKAAQTETSAVARDILQTLIQNQKIASRERIPLCQDTGSLVVFAEVGADLHIEGMTLYEAINEAVRKAWTRLYLRASVTSDPLFGRENTRDNTPAIVHSEIVSGDRLRLRIAQKGGGAENMSALRMFTPGATPEDIIQFVTETVSIAGGKPCPPIIIGIGIGGNFETCALLAKKALFVPLGAPHPEPDYACLERDIVSSVNATGIGPQGLGGNTTALAVHILHAPCHIASLPVAINIQCHAHRHGSIEL